jgi:hypothetical protein
LPQSGSALSAGAAASTEMELRAQRWDSAPRYTGSVERVQRRDESDGPRATEVEWARIADSTDTDCRGCASKNVPSMARHKVVRVPTRKEGYCRRNTCECCAPHAQAHPGAREGQWCSCLAVHDGLCRRCWLDYHGGPATWKSQYWGPV